MRKFYLDTNLVTHKVTQDQTKQAAAFAKVEAAHAAGTIQQVTSEVTAREIARLQSPDQRVKFMRAYNAMEKVPMIEATAHPTWSALRKTGLDSADAQHVMIAIETGCAMFLTCDRRTIIRHRAPIEQMYPSIKLRTPSEYAASASAVAALCSP